MNGSSAYSNGNSFGLGGADDPRVKTLPYWFRAALPVMVTLVSGI
jgi:hypothetical protein